MIMTRRETMRLRAGLGLLCVALAGCQHVPEGVDVDLQKGLVKVGPCTCSLPAPEQAEKGEAAPGDEPR